jgi:hypothetical protein
MTRLGGFGRPVKESAADTTGARAQSSCWDNNDAFRKDLTMCSQTPATNTNNQADVIDIYVNQNDGKQVTPDPDGPPPKGDSIHTSAPPGSTVEATDTVEADGTKTITVKITPPGADAATPPKTPDTAAPKTPDSAAPKVPDSAAPKVPDSAAPKAPDTAAPKAPSPNPNGDPTPAKGAAAPAPAANNPNRGYTSKYGPNDKIDQPMLDAAKKAGGKVDSDGNVTLNNVALKKGQPLGSSGVEALSKANIERPEVETGAYRKGDTVTPAMEHDLIAKGYTKNANNTFTSPDQKTTITPDQKGKLTEGDAKALTDGGVKRSSAFDRTDPNSAYNTDYVAGSKDHRPVDMDATSAKNLGYTGTIDPDHPPKYGDFGNSNNASHKDPNVATVYEYNKTTGNYEPAGEVWRDQSNGGAQSYHKYTDAQKQSVMDRTATIGSAKLWPNNPTNYS